MTRLHRAALGVALVVGLCSIGTTVVRGYVLKNVRWPDGRIVMQMQLGESGRLIDGNTRWGAPVEGAMFDWNQYLSGVRFTVVRDSTAAIAERNGLNNVFFSDNVYGDAFGSSTVAIAQSFSRNGTRTESDVIFNTAKSWNSYRGRKRSGIVDIRRVALHELGHVLGLDHPDEAGQSVAAIMNSEVSDTDALQADDIQGGRAIYGATTTPTPTPSPSTPSGYPASPHPYGDNVDTTWTYTLAGNPAAINVTFDARTAVEEWYDQIHVMDAGGNAIAGSPFTGATLAARTVLVTGSTVRIRLTSDRSITAWGFAVTAITAATVPPPLSSSYPASSHPYSNDTDWIWWYSLFGNPSAINVTFDGRTQLERGYDFLYVMDANGNNIAGSPFTGTDLAGVTRRVPGSMVRLRLVSDESITAWGFAVTNITRATSPIESSSSSRSDQTPRAGGAPPTKTAASTADSSPSPDFSLLGVPRPPAVTPPLRATMPSRTDIRRFRRDLETARRGGTGVSFTTFVDAAAAADGLGEYVRYRALQCDHDAARQRVMAQIDGWGIQPGCGVPASVTLPAAADMVLFRRALEAKYRDDLRRVASASSVDVPDEVVSMLNYLRARLLTCSHEDATAGAFQSLRGGMAPVTCR